MESVIKLLNIDLNLLLILALLLQTRSVSATARKVGFSQPTASRALSRLRELFEDPLLIRTNHGMELTRKAEELSGPLQEWLATTNALFVTREFDASTIERCFRVATTDFGVTSVIAPTLSRLRPEVPGASFEISSLSDDIHAKLASGELDFVLTGLKPDFSTAYGRHLFSDPYLCVLRADHPLLETQRDRLSLDEFLHWPHIGLTSDDTISDTIASCLGNRAEERHLVGNIPYSNTLPFLVTGTDTIATVARRTASLWHDLPGLAFLAAPEEIKPLDYWVIYHERSRRDSATLWIVDRMAEACTA